MLGFRFLHPQRFRSLFFPKLRASSIDSGNFSPVVSGNRNARHPAKVAIVPMIIIGKGFHILLSEPISRDNMPEILKNGEAKFRV